MMMHIVKLTHGPSRVSIVREREEKRGLSYEMFPLSLAHSEPLFDTSSNAFFDAPRLDWDCTPAPGSQAYSARL